MLKFFATGQHFKEAKKPERFANSLAPPVRAALVCDLSFPGRKQPNINSVTTRTSSLTSSSQPCVRK